MLVSFHTTQYDLFILDPIYLAMNTPYASLILKPKKDKAIANYHHWIFSGAVQHASDLENGSIVAVYTAEKELLGHAYYNNKCSIVARMISFGHQDPLDALAENVRNAISFRKKYFLNRDTTAYRLINSEGDRLPGLIVDQYGDVLVVQISTLGMEKLKDHIVKILLAELAPAVIYEKSNLPSRREEGLLPFEQVLNGTLPAALEIVENGLRFLVDVPHGQKTGFFLDQREMRKLVSAYAKGKKVLNCFSYSGGFSVYAMQGGAVRADSVDISEAAIQLARQNFALNSFDMADSRFHARDVFAFLRDDELAYDFIILDPPAFAKTKNDVVKACRGYKDINRLAMQKMPSGSFLLTSSCSYFVDDKLFQTVVFQAAREANRTVRIIGRHILAPDHPINIYHPEGEYLKSLLLYVE